jgi:hypothetical protein
MKASGDLSVKTWCGDLRKIAGLFQGCQCFVKPKRRVWSMTHAVQARFVDFGHDEVANPAVTRPNHGDRSATETSAILRENLQGWQLLARGAVTRGHQRARPGRI